MGLTGIFEDSLRLAQALQEIIECIVCNARRVVQTVMNASIDRVSTAARVSTAFRGTRASVRDVHHPSRESTAKTVRYVTLSQLK